MSTPPTRPNKTLRKLWRIAYRGLFLLFIIVAGLIIYFKLATRQELPKAAGKKSLLPRVSTMASGLKKCGNGWLRQSSSGLWEMYVEGGGYERGVMNGRLTKELAERQETVFINQIKELVPSMKYLKVLNYFVAYFNRHLPEHVSEEYKDEIYGVSLSASDKYDGLATKYYRILNYHGAHDIGHALQDKNMTVGCTSFGVWGSKTSDGKLLIGRNFDFFAGDEFAVNKIVCFTRPETGYKFMYVTWAGFTGVVSGMNDQGLTVTLNAAKSEIPASAATPISLLAKEILQYARTIQEAYAIVRKRRTFVSESILIGSTADHRAAIIEKTPVKTNLYMEPGEQLICSNHFKSHLFANDYLNNKNKVESSSLYRDYRMRQLLARIPIVGPKEAARALRDQNGINDRELGRGNEKGINQLLAHHSIIFKPEEQLVWVSTAPYQLGKYVCYDLNKIFKSAAGLTENKELQDSDKVIAEDPFLSSRAYRDFLLFKHLKYYLEFCTKSACDIRIDKKYITAFLGSNPKYYMTYWTLGNYYSKLKDKEQAKSYYTMTLSKEVATLKERNKIEEQMAELEKPVN